VRSSLKGEGRKIRGRSEEKGKKKGRGKDMRLYRDR
jgi:hypothetical protein